jgi:hypothetical protein
LLAIITVRDQASGPVDAGLSLFGTGGLAGVLSPSANGVDVNLSLGQGYATAVTSPTTISAPFTQ